MKNNTKAYADMSLAEKREFLFQKAKKREAMGKGGKATRARINKALSGGKGQGTLQGRGKPQHISGSAPKGGTPLPKAKESPLLMVEPKKRERSTKGRRKGRYVVG